MNTQTELAKIEQRAKIKRVTGKTLTYFFLSVWGIFVLFPFYWMILTSVKSYSAYNAEYTPKFWTMAPTLENYRAAFTTVPLAKYFLNTLIFTRPAFIPASLSSSTTAFAVPALDPMMTMAYSASSIR